LDTSSDLEVAGQRRSATGLRRSTLRLVAALALFAWIPGQVAAAGKVFLTADEALALAFPKCEITRTTEYLSPAQLERAKDLAGVPIDGAIVRPWAARADGKLVGFAYLDTHKVRTLPETILVVVDPKGRVARIEVLSFSEPEDYLPRGNWYAQFQGKELDPELRLKGSIRPVTGASLTASATTDAVRRVLALHRVLEHEGSGAEPRGPEPR
jgi:electron transport complex protein RnfG